MSRTRIYTTIFVIVILLVTGFYITFTYDGLVGVKKYLHENHENAKPIDIAYISYEPEHKQLKAIGDFLVALGVGAIIYLLVESSLHKAENKANHKQLQEIGNKLNTANTSQLNKIIESLNSSNSEQFDKIQKRLSQAEEDVRREVLSGVLGVLIPKELVEILLKDVLNSQIIKKNAVWEYEISEHNDCYYLKRIITYELHNIGSSEAPHKVNISVQHNNDGSSEYLSYKLVDDNGEVLVEHTKDTIDKCISSDGINKKIDEKEIKIPAKHYVIIYYTMLTKYCNKYVSDVHYTNSCCIGFTLRIKKPEDCLVEIIPSFSEKLEIEKQEEDRVYYKKAKGLLVGQALTYYLKPKVPNNTVKGFDSEQQIVIAEIKSLLGEQVT